MIINFQINAGNISPACKSVIKQWATKSIEDDIDSFFGSNAGNIVLALKEDILALVQEKVNLVRLSWLCDNI